MKPMTWEMVKVFGSEQSGSTSDWKLPFDATPKRLFGLHAASTSVPERSSTLVRNRHGATGLAARESVRFSVTGQIKHICPGPVVTTYEFKPDQA